MLYTISCNALIMLCNAPFNALYNLTNNCNTINWYTMLFKFGYNYYDKICITTTYHKEVTYVTNTACAINKCYFTKMLKLG